MNPLCAGPENPVRALVRSRPFQPAGTFRPRLPCHPPLPRPDPAMAQGEADTRTLLEESP